MCSSDLSVVKCNGQSMLHNSKVCMITIDNISDSAHISVSMRPMMVPSLRSLRLAQGVGNLKVFTLKQYRGPNSIISTRSIAFIGCNDCCWVQSCHRYGNLPVNERLIISLHDKRYETSVLTIPKLHASRSFRCQ